MTVLAVLDAMADGDPAGALREGRLSVQEVIDCAAEHYQTCAAALRPEESIRVHPLAHDQFLGHGGLTSVAVTHTDGWLAFADSLGPPDGSLLRGLRQLYTASFLYADHVIELDPLSFLAALPQSKRVDQMVHTVVNDIVELRPLIESGVLELVPVPPEDRSALAEVPDLLMVYREATSEALRKWTLTERFRERFWETATPNYFRDVEREHILRGARIANRNDAALVPYGALRKAMFMDIAGTANIDLQVTDALNHVSLPLFAGLSPKLLVSIRSDEDAFAAWRADMRLATRLIRSTSTPETFEATAQQVFKDLLVPRARSIEKSLSRSSAMRAAARDQPVQIALSAAFTSGAALAAGLPITGILLSAVGGMAGRIAAAGLQPVARQAGSAQIVAQLVKR